MSAPTSPARRSLPGVADQALVERGADAVPPGRPQPRHPCLHGVPQHRRSRQPGRDVPAAASQHAQYVEATLKSWHDGTTWGDDAQSQIMPAIAKKLDAKDITALASYIEGLHSTDGQAESAPVTP